MAYTDQYTLSSDAIFKGKISIAMVRAAIAVIAEDASTLSLPVSFRGDKGVLHDKRAEFAVSILREPTAYVDNFSLAVASDPNTAGITGASTDSDLQFTVNAVFSSFVARN